MMPTQVEPASFGEGRPGTLYLTRTGLLEPLGQSQVLPYLRGLARDHRITLITRERADDLADTAAVARQRADCAACGIDWRPGPFRSRPRFIAPARDLLGMTSDVWREARAGRIALIHARSYIPAAVAWAVWRLTGVPFIFDMRALWPEEMITAGRLRRGSFVHRLIRAAERACLRDAAMVVSLTEAAADHLRAEHAALRDGRRIVVIPTCVDLARFAPREARLPSPPGPTVHGCIGTILSGWFLADWLGAWFAAAAQRDPAARFEILTRCDPEGVRRAVDPQGRLGPRLTIGARAPEQMPAAIRAQDLSVMFYAGGEVSELGRSPTRMAEVLACGLPVVVNAGVGDVARIVTAERVGVVVQGKSPAQMSAALDGLSELMADPTLAERCRNAAERLFSLEQGVAAYAAIYAQILADGRKVGHAEPAR